MRNVIRQSLILSAKDTKIFFKDRFAVLFAFLFPLLFTLGFSLMMSGVGPDDERMSLTVAVREGADGMSRRIIDEMSASGAFDVREVDYSEAYEAVTAGELSGFIAFPDGFTDSFVRGVPTAIEVVSSGDEQGDLAALHGAARSIASRAANVQIASRAAVELGLGADGPASAARGLANIAELASASLIDFPEEQVGEVEPFNVTNFVLPGYLTMFIFFAAAMSAEFIVRERQSQTLERMISNGVRRESVVLGKFLTAAYRGLMQVLVLWGVGVAAFRIDFGVSPAAVVAVSLAMVFTASAFGVMLASIVRTVRAATAAGVLSSLVLAPLGGSWWPLFITPDWMQTLGKLTPHGWANTAFNNLMLFGAEFADVWMSIAALAGFGAAFLLIAFARFRLSDVA